MLSSLLYTFFYGTKQIFRNAGLSLLQLQKKNWKIPSAFKSVASLQHEASTASFIGSRAYFSSLRNKNSAVDMLCSIDKSSKSFDMHFFRHIPLNHFKDKVPAGFTI